MAQPIVFYLISGLAVFSALMVVTQRSVFTCALALAGFLSLVAGLFVLLSADFLAAAQVLVYVGGILVILVFAVMFSSVQQARLERQVNEQWFPSLLACLLVLFAILIGLKRNPFSSAGPGDYMPTTESIGFLLLNDLVLPFEVVSLVLLASLVGAVLFTRKESFVEDRKKAELPQ